MTRTTNALPPCLIEHIEIPNARVGGRSNVLLAAVITDQTIELLALGPLVLYEVDIHVRVTETVVRNLSLGALKVRRGDGDPRTPHRR